MRETTSAVLSKHELPYSKLRPEFDPAYFSFETTAELHAAPNEMIGQRRAAQAMEFGLGVEQTGYNLFVVGPTGTGKMTYTQESVAKMAEMRAVPQDWCYVYNFEDPDRPLVISFSAGQGQKFQRKVENLLVEIGRELQTAFSSDVYEKKKRAIVDGFLEQVDELWSKVDAFALEQNFKLERTQAGITTIPLRFGKPMQMAEFNRLSKENKELLKEKERLIDQRISDTIHQIRKIEDEIRNKVQEFMMNTASYAVEGLFQPLREDYKENDKVLAYLDAYFNDVVEHFSVFFSDEDEEQQDILSALMGSKEQHLHRYVVNLFVNNKGLKGAPAIYETNPTYHNLFGKLEYQGQLGSWVTDFSFIKPGALHLANGGYLIVQATELLQQPYAWIGLKRALQTESVRIENPYEERGAFPTSTIKPEPIPLDLKVIIIGSYYMYELLSTLDADFDKLFKVKVEFDTVMNKDEENSRKMASFVKNFAENENLLPFHRRAVAKVIDYSSRLVEEQSKLTTRFQDITKVLVESNYWAKKENGAYVDDRHIQKALQEKLQRSNHVPEQYREMIQNGTIMIETEGYRVGQINGLAVMGTLDSMFGIPTKITAQTYAGKTGIMNIEREAALSGQIHHKGMMILTGFLSGQFAKNRPIPLSASITFEQTYTPIDGDSASSTELYVLLSSLTEVPIHQGIAVTGSVNQWGEIQAIGGVNEKIEGFYHICRERGLTGEQGVIIPKQNVRNLMLDQQVVEAVREGQFHIWAIGHIAEGIEILTGLPAGNIRDENGHYPPNTIFAKADNRFTQMYKSMEPVTSRNSSNEKD